MDNRQKKIAIGVVVGGVAGWLFSALNRGIRQGGSVVPSGLVIETLTVPGTSHTARVEYFRFGPRPIWMVFVEDGTYRGTTMGDFRDLPTPAVIAKTYKDAVMEGLKGQRYNVRHV